RLFAGTRDDLGQRAEPCLDHAVQERHRVWAPLQRLPVEFKEQPLVWPEGGVGQPSPQRTCLLRGGQVSAVERGQRFTLPPLDFADHVDEQAFAGADVVDQHAVAGAESGGEPAEAEVTDPVLGNVVDGGGQQPVAWRRHVPYGTCTTRYIRRLACNSPYVATPTRPPRSCSR